MLSASVVLSVVCGEVLGVPPAPPDGLQPAAAFHRSSKAFANAAVGLLRWIAHKSYLNWALA